MTEIPPVAPGRHLIGLGFAAVLAAGCYGIYLYIPGLVRGLGLRGMDSLAIFLVAVVALSLCDALWARLTRPKAGASRSKQ